MAPVRQEVPQRPKRVRSRRPVMARASEGKHQAADEAEQSPVEVADSASQESQTGQQEST